jgi:hypothetical protein
LFKIFKMQILSKLLISSQLVVAYAISAQDGIPYLDLPQVHCWRVVAVSALEGTPSPDMSQIHSWCAVQNEKGQDSNHKKGQTIPANFHLGLT